MKLGFKYLDTNRDGYITYKDIEELLRRRGKKDSKKKYLEQIKDKKIDF